MRTIEQAIREETARYVDACRKVEGRHAYSGSFDAALRRARWHRKALARLRHHVVTPHEAICAATPTVHAYADLDGYGR